MTLNVDFLYALIVVFQNYIAIMQVNFVISSLFRLHLLKSQENNIGIRCVRLVLLKTNVMLLHRINVALVQMEQILMVIA